MPSFFANDYVPYDRQGNRLFLTLDERQRFLAAARQLEDIDPARYTLCETLVWTGGRISEVLSLTPDAVALTQPYNIRFHCLKKRNRIVIRHVPVSEEFAERLNQVHNLQNRQKEVNASVLWPVHRSTALNWVKTVMNQAGIDGTQANCKGLRHAFASYALSCGIPLDRVQRWMGHSNIATTTTYTNIVTSEEWKLSRHLWQPQPVPPCSRSTDYPQRLSCPSMQQSMLVIADELRKMSDHLVERK